MYGSALSASVCLPTACVIPAVIMREKMCRERSKLVKACLEQLSCPESNKKCSKSYQIARDAATWHRVTSRISGYSALLEMLYAI